MSIVTDSVEIAAPVQATYTQWCRFEQFPALIPAVEQVEHPDRDHLHWRARFIGRPVEWDTEITEQVPYRRLAWRSMEGPQNRGVVNFDPLRHEHTRLTLRVEYRPTGVAANLADALGLVSWQLHRSLMQFKRAVEAGPPHS